MGSKCLFDISLWFLLPFWFRILNAEFVSKLSKIIALFSIQLFVLILSEDFQHFLYFRNVWKHLKTFSKKAEYLDSHWMQISQRKSSSFWTHLLLNLKVFSFFSTFINFVSVILRQGELILIIVSQCMPLYVMMGRCWFVPYYQCLTIARKKKVKNRLWLVLIM